jgi:hypothetical protein
MEREGSDIDRSQVEQTYGGFTNLENRHGTIILQWLREPWNKGKLVGRKLPFRLKEIWAIRIRLQLGERLRELALSNLAIDSKLRSCDMVKLRMRDVTHGDRVAARQ